MSLILSFFLLTATFQQNGPYVELYDRNTGGDMKKIDITQPVSYACFPTVKVFNQDGTEVNCLVRSATVSLVRGTYTVNTIQVKNTNHINLDDFRAIIRPGDRIVINLRTVWNQDKQKEIYLKKYTFNLSMK